MIDYVVLGIIAIIILLIIIYIIKEKRKGKKCIGCPCAGECSQAKCGKNNEY